MPTPTRRFCWLFFVTSFFFAAFCIAGTAGAQKSRSAVTRTYHGAWFDVQYPADFSAAPASSNPLSNASGDSATFTSPDKRVHFYVFSPQWNGEPSFVKVATSEKIVSQTRETRKDASRTYTTNVKWVTVEARDRSYTRTWEDTETSLNTRRVFGVKYQTEADFRKYRPQYLAFKKSLRQFGD